MGWIAIFFVATLAENLVDSGHPRAAVATLFLAGVFFLAFCYITKHA